MTFAYDAGSADPDYAGLIEWPDLRLTSDGTFRPLVVPPLAQSAPLRVTTVSIPGDGGYVPAVRLDAWQFDVAGWFLLDDVADVPEAIDYLMSKVNAYLGEQTVTLNAQGWTGTRQMTVRLAGQIDVTVPDKGEMKTPTRVFTIPLIAADPRRYASTEQSVTVTTTDLTNAGNYPAPFTVRFNGPRTNPQIDGPGTAGTNRIRVARTLATGEWVEVSTWSDGVTTAVDSSGANALGDLSAATASVIEPGTSSWAATSDSGTGDVVVSFRDAWA